MLARELYDDLWPHASGQPPNGEIAQDDIGSLKAAFDELPSVLPRTAATQSLTSNASVQTKLNTTFPSCTFVPETVSSVDFTTIRVWGRQCIDSLDHLTCRASPFYWSDLPGVQFRVIDVRRRCITTPPMGSAFVALTYVWGNVKQPMLTSTTKSILMHDGGIDIIWSRLPTTIRDAIIACERVGERYLWVDALCIVQDSLRDMRVQILQMRNIYKASRFVFAAASAETSHGGLLSNHATNFPLFESEDDLSFFLDSSPWGARAWCYQEKVLSHRIILFTSCGIYMQCQQGTYDLRGIKLPRRRKLNEWDSCGAMLAIPPDHRLDFFASAVEHYSRRQLSRADDRLNAFQGVLHQFSSGLDDQSWSFRQGLPVHAFDQAFCWRSHEHDPSSRIPSFPTWSWLGWNQAISFDRGILNKYQTSQILRGTSLVGGVGYEQYLEHLENLKLRKPASLDGPTDKDPFGFPAAIGVQGLSDHELTLFASIAVLSVAGTPGRSISSNGLYDVNYIKSGVQTFSLASQPTPLTAKEASGLSSKAQSANENDDSIVLHKQQPCLLAMTPVGHIWLDREWREEHGNTRPMKFMALTGTKDPSKPGRWIITLLMLIHFAEEGQPHSDEQLIGRYKRIQVMDCSIDEDRWAMAGAKTTFLELV